MLDKSGPTLASPEKKEIIILKKSLEALTIYFIATFTDAFLFHFQTCVEARKIL